AAALIGAPAHELRAGALRADDPDGEGLARQSPDGHPPDVVAAARELALAVDEHHDPHDAGAAVVVEPEAELARVDASAGQARAAAAAHDHVDRPVASHVQLGRAADPRARGVD